MRERDILAVVDEMNMVTMLTGIAPSKYIPRHEVYIMSLDYSQAVH